MDIKFTDRWAGISGIIASLLLVISVVFNYLMVLPYVNFYGGESLENIIKGLPQAKIGLSLYAVSGLTGTLFIIPMILRLSAFKNSSANLLSAGITAMLFGVPFLVIAYSLSFVVGYIAPMDTDKSIEYSFVSLYRFISVLKDLGFSLGSGLTLGTAPLFISLALRKSIGSGIVYLGIVGGIFSHSWYLFFFVPIQFILFGVLGAYLIMTWFLWLGISMLMQMGIQNARTA